MTNVRKYVTNEHNNVSKILVLHCLARLTFIGVRYQIQHVFFGVAHQLKLEILIS